MAITSNEQLPQAVLDVLPEDAQNMWRDVYNNAYNEYHNEEQAAKVAWSQIEKLYEKSADGKWHKK